MLRKIHDNSLSLVTLALFLVLLLGQSVTGHREHNHDREDHGELPIGFSDYLTSGHFLEATMENWESEFLQMGAFVVLTAMLYQKGSAESRDPDKREPVSRDPRRVKVKPDSPWPVRRGGVILWIYERSLSFAFFILFFLSLILHAVGGAEEHSREQIGHGGNPVSALEFAATSRFWFESFQNWQSEFLAVFSMVVFSIYLRQRGSAESKPVDAPHSETGK